MCDKLKKRKRKGNSREHLWCLEKRMQTVHRVPVIPLAGEYDLFARSEIMQGEDAERERAIRVVRIGVDLPFPLGFTLVVVRGLFISFSSTFSFPPGPTHSTSRRTALG